jgi:hypothetical protein
LARAKHCFKRRQVGAGHAHMAFQRVGQTDAAILWRDLAQRVGQ